MTAFNFQKRFVDPILSGRKRSTIRRARAKGGNPRPGSQLQLYHGQRTNYCRKLQDVVCTRVRPIVVMAQHWSPREWRLEIVLDGVKLDGAQIENLARAEGFDGASDMCEFFAEKYGSHANLWLIEW